MNKKSRTPPSNTVRVTIQGSGKNIWAYALSDAQYKRVQKNLRPGGEEAIALIQSDYEAGALICWGVGADQYPKPKVTLNIAGKQIEYMIAHVDDDEISDDIIKDLRENEEIADDQAIVFYYNKTMEGLEDIDWGDNRLTGFALEKSNHIVMEVIDWKKTTLSVEIPVDPKDFDIKKFFIVVRQMDSSGEMSSLVYPHEMADGWPTGENDIIGILYDGEKYKFEAESSGAQARRWWAFMRDGSDWEEDHATNIFFKYG